MATTTNWTNIEVTHGRTEWNGTRILFHQCQARDTRPISRYGWYGVESERCGSDAHYLVTRTSLVTGHTYTDQMCPRHAQGWGSLPT